MQRIRFARIAPYLKGKGPTFRVEIWDTFTTDNRGCTRLIARLYMFDAGKRTHVLDMPFCNGPWTADDSNQSMAMAIEGVAMKPGDTDADFFADYTPEALAVVSKHGDSLAMVAYDRFGEV